MNFTSEQHEAIYNHERNMIVVAGAGSGKTRVLVERFLALLEARPDWSLSALVAITFTKKAAEEMRDRVRQGLEARLFNTITESDMNRWAALLAQIDSARIDTIHGLCADLLRANAAYAHLDPDFEVLDEVEAAILLEDVVEAMLAEVVQSGSAEVSLLTQYEVRDIRRALADPELLNIAFDAAASDYLEYCTQLWQQLIKEQIALFRHRIDGVGTFSPVDDSLGERWQQCSQCLDKICDVSLEVQLEALNGIDAIDMRGVRISKRSIELWGDEVAFNEAKVTLTTVRETAREALKQIGAEPGQYDERAAEMLPVWIELVNRVRRAFRAAKDQRGALDFNDLEHLTCDLLNRVPEVALRYRGTEFKHLLVDEFQDTNGVQWQIVQALAGLDTAGSLFVVGDEKQSIYAFRGADVSVFGDVRDQIVTSGGAQCYLSQSFRTHNPLVNCFNGLFGRLLIREEANPVARYQVQLGKLMTAFRAEPPANGPHLEMLLIDNHLRGEDGEAHDKLNAEDRRRCEARYIALRIKTMLDDGCLVYDKTQQKCRPLQLDDIVVLFRSLSDVTLYEDVFKAEGVRYETIAGRGYYDRQEVWDLLSLLQAVYNPADNLSLAVALRSPLFGLSDDALFALRLQTDERDEPVALWQALQEPGDLIPVDEIDRLNFAARCLDDLRQMAGRVTIYELIQASLEQTGYLATLTGLPDGTRRRRNVEKLLEKAQTGGQLTLGAFSKYLRDMSAREAREGDAVVDVTGAVRFMTIHASKGLEFPVVILVDAARTPRVNTNKPLVFDPQLGLACKVFDELSDAYAEPFIYRRVKYLSTLREEAENLRLLYVAATRAQDYLIVSGQIDELKNETWKTSGLLAYLLEAAQVTEYLHPCSDEVYNLDWGQIRVMIPRLKPDDIRQMHTRNSEQTLWDVTPPSIAPAMPLLLNDVDVKSQMQARHLAATHIADLGSIEQAGNTVDQKFYRDRFRRQVLHDAPTSVQRVSYEERPAVTQRQIGEIVHEALRYWRIPDGENEELMHKTLRSYAWQHGITDAGDSRRAVARAYDLLVKFRHSDIYHLVDLAKFVYREIPFVYERDGYVLNGVIDALLQMPDGSWIVADYKTSYVPDASTDADAVKDHARRYYLQLGIYAEAVQQQLNGIVPVVYIHYIRYNQTVFVPENKWRAAVTGRLTEHIEQIIEDKPL